ncbi:hypothetical protein HRG_006993 [Hirsutella rhossiliensis]|uniref:Uncharacterized protein n=1 Tax=Hirsutella rhossiliensis TaxID=111463 RepID=A0A9P8MTR8_9HYPO|nr:uncharacterized protein HRG_06993 [Hirsutella rhossiliensis]KAH0961913.1 hypothetical protein HRG_06993 [Hirsutella rhossiliensis]
MAANEDDELFQIQPTLSRLEIYRCLRRLLEIRHRRGMLTLLYDYLPEITFCLRGVPVDHLLDCGNKMAPVYFLESIMNNTLIASSRVGDYPRFPGYAFQYIYRRWFVPYKRNIEYNQFLVKFFEVQGIPNWLQAKPRRFLGHIVNLSASLCAKVKETQLEIMSGKPEDVQHMLEYTARYGLRPPWARRSWLEQVTRARAEQEFLQVQPLFRAIAIIVGGRDESCEDMDGQDFPTRMDSVGQTPVLFVCTGVEDGLSAPICFDSVAHQIHSLISGPPGTNIRTALMSLEAAITLTLDLEKREVAAFGPRPDPARSPWLPSRPIDRLMNEARWLGAADVDLAGPSSSWVDTEVYSEQLGDAAERDKVVAYSPDEVHANRYRLACWYGGNLVS